MEEEEEENALICNICTVFGGEFWFMRCKRSFGNGQRIEAIEWIVERERERE